MGKTLPVHLRRLSFSSFNLQATLDSGQIFRYSFEHSTSSEHSAGSPSSADSSSDPSSEISTGFWYVQHHDCVLKLQQKRNLLYYAGVHADGNEVTEKEIRHFFRLDQTHEHMLEGLNQDPYISELSRRYRGIHLLRQDLFECIVSFLCSSASNIPKIKKNVELLCESFGKPFTFEGKTYHAFPEPGSMESLRKIKDAKTGFRARYIHEANSLLTLNLLERMRTASYTRARELLLTLPGIGEKIANCILLFSLEHMRAFPIDTWMRKAMLDNYAPELMTHLKAQVKLVRIQENKKQENRRQEKKRGRLSLREPKLSEQHMSRFGEQYFGDSAGLAQQYLYVHARKKDI